MVEKLDYRVIEVDVQVLCYTLSEVDAETLIYALTDRLPVLEEYKVGNMPVKVECKAVLNTLAARETEVKVHTFGNTLSEPKGMETLQILNNTVAENEIQSLATHSLRKTLRRCTTKWLLGKQK